MAVRGLHAFDGKKTLQVAFTGPDGRRVLAPAAAGQNLLQVALEAGVKVEHACGGVGGCASCHVHVTQGGSALSKVTDAELDRLDEAPLVREDSRLACQAVILDPASSSTVAIEVEVPRWNINAVSEEA